MTTSYNTLWRSMRDEVVQINTWLSPRCVLSSPWCTPLALSCDVWSPLHLDLWPRQSLDSGLCWALSCGVGRGDEAAHGSVLRASASSGWSQILLLRWSHTLVADVSTCCCWTLWWYGQGHIIVQLISLYFIPLQHSLFMKLINELVNMRGSVAKETPIQSWFNLTNNKDLWVKAFC